MPAAAGRPLYSEIDFFRVLWIKQWLQSPPWTRARLHFHTLDPQTLQLSLDNFRDEIGFCQEAICLIR